MQRVCYFLLEELQYTCLKFKQGEALEIKETRQRIGRPRSFLAIIRSYLVVVIIFIAFLLSIGIIVVFERFLLGLA